MKCYASIGFGLLLIGTGLLRSVEAQAFKPNAFWFCLVTGLLAIGAGYLFRLGKSRTGVAVAATTSLLVICFYMYCLITQPEKDATYRVCIAIMAGFAELSLILLPAKDDRT
jgi:hypothetical protein|eukprot:COSAG01_NODE_1681_length_9505_cov_149.510419_2_plen_112_part_00